MFVADGAQVDWFVNADITSITTPIKVDILEKMLIDTKYDKQKTQYLVDRFKNGFDIGYRGPTIRQDLSNNIPIVWEPRLTCGTRS